MEESLKEILRKAQILGGCLLEIKSVTMKM
jgi:hypothetical protein